MEFDLQPELHGELLQLRPLRADDFGALFGVASDPLLWEQHPAQDRHEQPVFRAFFAEQLGSGGALAVVDRRSGAVVGTSRFHGYDATRSEVEIGWTFLSRSHWGGVYNGELKQLMLGHAFRFVDRVVFVIAPQNLRSQRSVEKLGAVRSGTRTNPSGREHVVYEIARAAWV